MGPDIRPTKGDSILVVGGRSRNGIVINYLKISIHLQRELESTEKAKAKAVVTKSSDEHDEGVWGFKLSSAEGPIGVSRSPGVECGRSRLSRRGLAPGNLGIDFEAMRTIVRPQETELTRRCWGGLFVRWFLGGGSGLGRWCGVHWARGIYYESRTYFDASASLSFGLEVVELKRRLRYSFKSIEQRVENFFWEIERRHSWSPCRSKCGHSRVFRNRQSCELKKLQSDVLYDREEKGER